MAHVWLRRGWTKTCKRGWNGWNVFVLSYKGEWLAQTYKPDFICYSKIIVELKAVKEITPEHKAQLLNYLKASGLELGLFVNFGAYPKAEIVRIANTNFRDFRAFRG